MSSQEMFIERMANDRSYCLMPPETTAEEALKILHEVLLNGTKPSMPMNEEQMNTWIVHTLLTKYSFKYDRAVFKARQERINPNEGYV